MSQARTTCFLKIMSHQPWKMPQTQYAQLREAIGCQSPHIFCVRTRVQIKTRIYVWFGILLLSLSTVGISDLHALKQHSREVINPRLCSAGCHQRLSYALHTLIHAVFMCHWYVDVTKAQVKRHASTVWCRIHTHDGIWRMLSWSSV